MKRLAALVVLSACVAAAGGPPAPGLGDARGGLMPAGTAGPDGRRTLSATERAELRRQIREFGRQRSARAARST